MVYCNPLHAVNRLPPSLVSLAVIYCTRCNSSRLLFIPMQFSICAVICYTQALEAVGAPEFPSLQFVSSCDLDHETTMSSLRSIGLLVHHKHHFVDILDRFSAAIWMSVSSVSELRHLLSCPWPYFILYQYYCILTSQVFLTLQSIIFLRMLPRQFLSTLGNTQLLTQLTKCVQGRWMGGVTPRKSVSSLLQRVL